MKFSIPNIIFVLLIAISTGYLTFLTTKGGLTNNRHPNFWKKLTKRGKLVLYVLIFMILILAAQEYNSKNSNYNKDLQLQDDPIIIIDSVGIFLKPEKDKKIHYGINFTSFDAGSTNHNINTNLLAEFKDGSYDLSEFNFFPKNVKIPKNGKWTTWFTVNSSKDINRFFLYLKGTYTTLDGTKSYDIDEVYVYEDADKKTYTLGNSERNRIIKLIQTVPEKLLILQE